VGCSPTGTRSITRLKGLPSDFAKWRPGSSQPVPRSAAMHWHRRPGPAALPRSWREDQHRVRRQMRSGSRPRRPRLRLRLGRGSRSRQTRWLHRDIRRAHNAALGNIAPSLPPVSADARTLCGGSFRPQLDGLGSTPATLTMALSNGGACGPPLEPPLWACVTPAGGGVPPRRRWN
jgi:hypothetical protein